MKQSSRPNPTYRTVSIGYFIRHLGAFSRRHTPRAATGLATCLLFAGRISMTGSAELGSPTPSSIDDHALRPPSVVLSEPRLARTDSNASQFRFRLRGLPSEVYIIEASTNLLDWTVAGAYQAPPGGEFLMFDPTSRLHDRAFYRVTTQPRNITLALPSAGSSMPISFNGLIPVASPPNQLNPLNQPPPPPVLDPARVGFRPDRILIKPKVGVLLSALTPLHVALGGQVVRTFPEMGNLQVLKLSGVRDLATVLRNYRGSGLVTYAEPDYLIQALAEPNDMRFGDGSLWNMHNIGQTGGLPDADIDAPEAWDIRTSAENVVVAVIDTGVRYTHEDLSANMWVNPGETPGNGIDDDNDGFIDDVHGINAIANTGDPADDHGHGSHIAGIIGALGNNRVGVVGVAWKVRLMACKFISPDAQGALSDAITCIDYARKHGANVINASWGLPEFNSPALRDAIESCRQAGIIFVAAAGNSGNDDDTPSNAIYPASFDLDNIVSVLATTRRDELAFFSNYGASKVDLGAPGTDIFSCWNSSDD